MKHNSFLKTALPYLVAFLLFSGIAMIYFAPQYQGKVLSMHDDVQYVGSSQDIREHKAAYGEDPQWAGGMFSGMPSYMISFDYKTDIIKGIDKVFHFLGNPAAYIFISMLSFFLMLLMWGVNPWIGIIPALAYGLSTYSLIIIGAGHLAKVLALAYAPLVIGSVYYTYRRDIWLGAAMTALFGSLLIVVNHPQIVYYFFLVLLAFWINELVLSVRKKIVPHFVKATLVLALAGVLAVGANFAPLWYAANHTKETIRGGTELTAQNSESNAKGLAIDYATQWSYGKAESINMLIPNLMGGASDSGYSDDGPVAQVLTKYGARQLTSQLPTYWGEQPITSGPTYIGAVIIFLAVLGLFLLKGRSKWWIISISVLALVLAWGKNFMWFTELFFNYFPLYDKFRTVSMTLVILQWSIPFVAALGLSRIYNSDVDRKKLIESIKKSLYIVGGITLFFILFSGSLFSFSAPYDPVDQLPADVIEAMREERAQILRSDAIRSLIFIMLTAGVVWLFAVGKIKRVGFAGVLAALVVIDLVVVDMRYMPQSKFMELRTAAIVPTEADKQIMEDKSLGYRVFNRTVSPFNDATTSYFHRSVGGYHGAKLQRYQDVIDRYLSQGKIEIFNMLNTKYIITPDDKGVAQVSLNPDANGAAWLADSVIYATTADEQIELIGYVDNKKIAVVEEQFKPLIGELQPLDSTSKIELTDYKVNHLTYRSSSDKAALAVFSEIYYDKGWTAYLDGVQVPYIRADYILRAMYLPAGEHTIEFKFSAPNFSVVSMITMLSGALIILLVFAAAIYKFMQYRKKNGSGQQ